MFGMFTQITTCSQCSGSGEFVINPCQACRGSGRAEREKKIKVKIPAGVDSGFKLRVRNEGEAGEAGHGDLYVFINVKESKIFKRDGNNVYLIAPITFSQAALGDKIEIPTLDGKTNLKIPPGTQSGTTFRLNGKGIPYVDGYGTGDQFVKIKVKTPKSLSKQEKELFEELRKTENSSGFFDKLRDSLFG